MRFRMAMTQRMSAGHRDCVEADGGLKSLADSLISTTPTDSLGSANHESARSVLTEGLIIIDTPKPPRHDEANLIIAASRPPLIAFSQP